MDIIVRPDGRIDWHNDSADGVLGRGGVRIDKREGDGATPAGRFPLRQAWWRADRVARPDTALPCQMVGVDDGWCDDPADPAYNCRVKLPYPARHERLWRDDHIYDLLMVIGHNDDPVVAGAGSAVFVHLTRPTRAATDGCVALDEPDLRRLLAVARPGDFLVVRAQDTA